MSEWVSEWEAARGREPKKRGSKNETYCLLSVSYVLYFLQSVLSISYNQPKIKQNEQPAPATKKTRRIQFGCRAAVT